MIPRLSTLVAALSLALAPAACLFDPDDHPGPLDEPTGTDGGETDDDEAQDPGTDGGEDDDAEPADEGEEASTGDAVCIELDEPCTQGADCCDYDPEFPPGSSQCVAVDQQAACTTICLSAEDCDTGCCAALQGITAYGACVAASLCAGG